MRYLIRYIVAYAVVFLLIGLAIAFVDRPLADWVSDHHTARWAGIKQVTRFAEYLHKAAPGAAVIAGLMLLAGSRRELAKVVLVSALAVMAASDIKDQLKVGFGRTWPETWIDQNPSWIKNRVFGFNFMRGGQTAYASFPSGHTTIAAAAMTVVGLMVPPLAPLAVLLVAVEAASLILMNYHWFSDCLAGALLGVTVGLIAVRLVSPPPPDKD